MFSNALIRRAALPCLLVGSILAISESRAALSEGLVSYWPMEEVAGGKTPDLVSGYDMTLNNLTEADLVEGKFGKCFSFSNAKQTLLSRIHGANDDLPANKHAAFTIAFWANVNGTGQTDLRLFSEGFTPNNNNPLFNIGTHNGGADGSVDLFIRQTGWTDVNHIKSIAQPFDGTWRHITFVQQEDGSRKLYVDGLPDELEIPAKEAGTWILNDTTIGGILRASASHWVTGLIDETAIWKRALSEAEITELKNQGLVSVFPPEAKGLVAHWPMEEVAGGKTPDLVSGYDMTLNNLTEADLVAGKFGKCFSFSNAKQTLLSRIHGANDDLPANKHAAFTIAFWANVNGTGQTDLRLFSEAFTPNNNNPLFNIGTHNGGTDGSVDLFIRQTGWTDVNHIKSTAQPFDGTWRHITFVQQEDGSRKLYVDGLPDDLEIPAKEAGTWILNDTTIGGILRASASHWVTGLIDETAIWKRALSEAEINTIKNSGVPKVITKRQPLEIKSFMADYPAAANGDQVWLRWEGSKDANYSLDQGVGDVTAQTAGGVGAKAVTVNATTTYTLTASRGNETLTAQFAVRAVPGVAAGWHLVETFEFLNDGNIANQSQWLGAEGLFSVISQTGNKALGFDDGADLTALKLNSFGLTEGQKGTLSFRIQFLPTPAEELSAPIGVHIGLTERSIRFNGDFNQNVGPYVRLERLAEGTTIDLLARNGVATQFYEGMVVDAFQPGVWYRLWMDVENKPFNVVDGVQNGGDVYSVYLQKEGDAGRTTVFENFLADRDAVTIDPALGAPTAHLTHVFISTPGTGQLANRVLVDDFFMSVGSYNSTVPYVPVVGPTEIIVTGSEFNPANGSFTLTWGSQAGLRYRVEKQTALGGSWTPLATGHPEGGAVGTSTSYTDTNAGAQAGFYRVVFTP
ncbi:MAG: LamG domain-containing protein [Verrucomicrobia bacterium]|nr:LamG domain-containing protein [Verrucomicrobiota bacterium]